MSQESQKIIPISCLLEKAYPTPRDLKGEIKNSGSIVVLAFHTLLAAHGFCGIQNENASQKPLQLSYRPLRGWNRSQPAEWNLTYKIQGLDSIYKVILSQLPNSDRFFIYAWEVDNNTNIQRLGLSVNNYLKSDQSMDADKWSDLLVSEDILLEFLTAHILEPLMKNSVDDLKVLFLNGQAQVQDFQKQLPQDSSIQKQESELQSENQIIQEKCNNEDITKQKEAFDNPLYVQGSKASDPDVKPQDSAEKEATPQPEDTPQAEITPQAEATPQVEVTPQSETTPQPEVTQQVEVAPQAEASPQVDATPQTEVKPQPEAKKKIILLDPQQQNIEAFKINSPYHTFNQNGLKQMQQYEQSPTSQEVIDQTKPQNGVQTNPQSSADLAVSKNPSNGNKVQNKDKSQEDFRFDRNNRPSDSILQASQLLDLDSIDSLDYSLLQKQYSTKRVLEALDSRKNSSNLPSGGSTRTLNAQASAKIQDYILGLISQNSENLSNVRIDSNQDLEDFINSTNLYDKIQDANKGPAITKQAGNGHAENVQLPRDAQLKYSISRYENKNKNKSSLSTLDEQTSEDQLSPDQNQDLLDIFSQQQNSNRNGQTKSSRALESLLSQKLEQELYQILESDENYEPQDKQGQQKLNLQGASSIQDLLELFEQSMQTNQGQLSSQSLLQQVQDLIEQAPPPNQATESNQKKEIKLQEQPKKQIENKQQQIVQTSQTNPEQKRAPKFNKTIDIDAVKSTDSMQHELTQQQVEQQQRIQQLLFGGVREGSIQKSIQQEVFSRQYSSGSTPRQRTTSTPRNMDIADAFNKVKMDTQTSNVISETVRQQDSIITQSRDKIKDVIIQQRQGSQGSKLEKDNSIAGTVSEQQGDKSKGGDKSDNSGQPFSLYRSSVGALRSVSDRMTSVDSNTWITIGTMVGAVGTLGALYYAQGMSRNRNQ